MENKLSGKLHTTGIGSLPFTDPEAAVEFVLGAGLDIPFWPQLPRRNAMEKMIPQYAAPMPCVKWDDSKGDVFMDTSDKNGELESFYGKYISQELSPFTLSEERAPGFYSFIHALESIDMPTAVKGQITGPLTFTTGISNDAGNTIYSDPELRDAAVKMLERTACRQIDFFQKHGADEVIIFADEPVLSAYGSSAYIGISEDDVIGMLSPIFKAISLAGGLSGLHVCGNSDWGMAMKSGVDILNFDAYQYGTTLALYSDQLKQFLDEGGVIAWGIVPTTEDIDAENLQSLTAKFHEALEALERKGFERSSLLEHSFLTPSCGAGSLDKVSAGKTFSLLRELKEALLTEAGGS